MKKKFLFILFFCGVACLLIYNLFKKDSINYLALGESNEDIYRYEYEDYFKDYLKSKKILGTFNKNYLRNDYTLIDVLDLITKIDSKKKINNGKSETITEVIHNSNIITMSFGNNEIKEIINNNYRDLNNKKVFKKIDIVIENYKSLISKIRKLTDSPIIILGYFNTYNYKKEEINIIYSYAEERLNEFKEFDNVYIIPLLNVISIDSKYIEKIDNYYISIEGYKYISNEIIDIFNKINA